MYVFVVGPQLCITLFITEITGGITFFNKNVNQWGSTVLTSGG